MLRLFIALEMPAPIQQALQTISADLQAKLPNSPLRWIPVPSIHLTLKFLGDVAEESVPAIQAELEQQAAAFAPFDLSVAELGVFPNVRRPRIVWVGVDAPSQLSALQLSVENAMEKLGYPAEQRDFTPHLTLARAIRGANPAALALVGKLVSAEWLREKSSASVDRVTLFQSSLNRGGAVYNPLVHAQLTGRK